MIGPSDANKRAGGRRSASLQPRKMATTANSSRAGGDDEWIDVAIVGCGVSGLGAAYAASLHPRVRLTLYESRAKLGGHANTIIVSAGRACALEGAAGRGARAAGPRVPLCPSAAGRTA